MPPANFLPGRHARILTAVLLAQMLGFYAISRRENVPLARPLADFPRELKGWRMLEQGVVEKETLDVLRADDVLTRVYGSAAANQAANLFVAFFKSQRTGQAPHSPKNCLPGSGWVPSEAQILSLRLPGLDQPIPVNRYVVVKADRKSLVLYWYQTRHRVIASEYLAKFYLVADAIRYNRTDTALVRVTVPILSNDEAAASQTALAFVESFFQTLKQHLPS